MIDKNDIENNLNRVHEWIKAADQKVSILFALEGIIITFIFTDVVIWVKRTIETGRCYSVIVGIGGGILLLFSVYKAVVAIMPRIKRKNNGGSLLYFGDIAKMKLSVFKERTRKVSKEKYEEQLLEQIHASSVIAASKYTHLKDSIWSLLLGMILLMAAYVIQYYGH